MLRRTGFSPCQGRRERRGEEGRRKHCRPPSSASSKKFPIRKTRTMACSRHVPCIMRLFTFSPCFVGSAARQGDGAARDERLPRGAWGRNLDHTTKMLSAALEGDIDPRAYAAASSKVGHLLCSQPCRVKHIAEFFSLQASSRRSVWGQARGGADIPTIRIVFWIYDLCSTAES